MSTLSPEFEAGKLHPFWNHQEGRNWPRRVPSHKLEDLTQEEANISVQILHQNYQKILCLNVDSLIFLKVPVHTA